MGSRRHLELRRERAIGERFGDMDTRYRLRAIEIGERARELQDTVIATRGKLHGGRSVFQKPHPGALGMFRDLCIYSV